jgi:hypothetical protein
MSEVQRADDAEGMNSYAAADVSRVWSSCDGLFIFTAGEQEL